MKAKIKLFAEFIVFLALLSAAIFASTEIVFAGTNRNYQVVDGVVRYDLPSYKQDGDKIYEMQPGTTNVRYDKPYLKLEGNRAYQVDPGTTTPRYDKPSFIIK